MYRIVCVFEACYWLSVNLVPARKVHGYTGALYVNACVHDLHRYSVYMCMYTYTYDCTVYTCAYTVYMTLLNMNAGLVCTYKEQNRSN